MQLEHFDTQYFCDLGIAIHQITTMFAGLQIYCLENINRNREMDHQDGGPGTFIEVQDIAQNEQCGTLKIEIDRLHKKMNDFKDEIIETLRKDMER